MIGPSWTFFLTPMAGGTDRDFTHRDSTIPASTYPYWQKYERMLRFARERDMIISVVLDMGDGKVHPAAGSDDEHRYIRYAVARFGAFSNITWDLGDDLDTYRDEKWAHETGTLLQGWDPYQHLATSHPTQIDHRTGLPAGLASPPTRNGLATNTLMLDHESCRRRQGESFPRRTRNTATRTIIRCGPSRLRFGRYFCAGPHGRLPWRRIPDRRGDRPPGNQHLARPGRRLDERARRRHHDHVYWLRAHGGIFHRL